MEYGTSLASVVGQIGRLKLKGVKKNEKSICQGINAVATCGGIGRTTGKGHVSYTKDPSLEGCG